MNYALENVILIGSVDYPLYRFTNRNIVLNSISGVITVDVIGNELSVDEFAVTVRHDTTGGRQLYAPIGDDAYQTTSGALYSLASESGRAYMTELPYATPIWWFCDGSLSKKGYIRAVDRVGKFAWRISCISGIGLLDNSYHSGGMYSGEAFGDVLADIIGDAFSYTVSNDAAENAVYGWLPYDTRRANLHRLLFAFGATMTAGDAETDYSIGFLDSTDPGKIEDARIALGGSVDYQLPATGVTVEENVYRADADDEIVTLFDTATPVIEQTVTFSDPCHDLTAPATLSIVESGVNYAIVSGYGQLTGKKYAHYTTMITLGGGKNIKTVSGNGLISALNSTAVAQRVFSYFSAAKLVRAKIQARDERCGECFNFSDPFGEPTFAFLQKMQLSVSSVKAASCEFVSGYTPTGQGNAYTDSVLLTGSGTWTVPDGVTMIRAVIASGGAGGMTGGTGQPGWGRYYQVPNAGHGGAGGFAGNGGRWIQIDISVNPGDTIAYSCGVGGDSDSAGTDSTFGAYSSAAGAPTPDGFFDIIHGTQYGMPGQNGFAGANQGGNFYTDPPYSGGQKAPDFTYGGVTVYGGSGGGAAYGGNGSNGSMGWVDERSGVVFGVYGGDGGDGGNATVPGEDASGLACGGNGGHGGGGGGDAGAVDPDEPGITFDGISGAGGYGSRGGRGGDGCIIVYY